MPTTALFDGDSVYLLILKAIEEERAVELLHEGA